MEAGRQRFLRTAQQVACALAGKLSKQVGGAGWSPQLPRLLHEYLNRRPTDRQEDLRELLAAQNKTNKLLQSIIYGGMGFVLGLIAMQVLVRVRLF